MLTDKWNPKKQGPFADIISMARLGDTSALKEIMETCNCKVYTLEELTVVNFLRREYKMEESSVIDTRHLDLILEVPDFNGKKHPCKVLWIEDLGNDIFLSGLEYIEGYPWDGCTSVYVLKKDPEVGFIPMFDAGWCLDEKTKPPEKEVV